MIKVFLIFSLFFLHSGLYSKTVVIDDFSKNPRVKSDEKKPPKNWSEGNEVSGNIDYYIVEEEGNKFLRGKYIEGTRGKIIYLRKEIDIKKTPFLSWRWRANKFPKPTIRRGQEEEDNVGTVYVLFKRGWTNYLVKYSWSQVNCEEDIDKEPVHFRSRSSRGLWNIHIRPLRCSNGVQDCCSDPSGEWLTEKVNLVEDFQMIFKRNWIPDKIEGIGILVDGDDTGVDGVSADFDDFILSSE